MSCSKEKVYLIFDSNKHLIYFFTNYQEFCDFMDNPFIDDFTAFEILSSRLYGLLDSDDFNYKENCL